MKIAKAYKKCKDKTYHKIKYFVITYKYILFEIYTYFPWKLLDFHEVYVTFKLGSVNPLR